MASRLSDAAVADAYDSGYRSLGVLPPDAGAGMTALEPSPLNLDSLINADDPRAAVQAVDPVRLYEALVSKGPEDCLDVLKHVSGEQLARFLDFDAWDDERLVLAGAVRWLKLMRETGTEELFRTFRGLDEEYQIALLESLVRVYDKDEYDALSQAEQDLCQAFPGQEDFWYRLTVEDPGTEDLVQTLIYQALAADPGYALSLLQHAAYLPPHEAEAGLLRFRNARLEEDGFVTFDEAQAAFGPLDLEELRRRWPRSGGIEAALTPAEAARGFFGRTMAALAPRLGEEQADGLRQAWVRLGNTLASAARIEPGERRALRLVLEQAQAAAGLGLEWLADGQIEVAAGILAAEHPRVLFQAGRTLVRRLVVNALTGLELAGLPEAQRVRRSYELGKFGQAMAAAEVAWLGILGFEALELLKGAMNRFPLIPETLTLADAGGPARVVFRPVESRADLRELAAELDRICADARGGATAGVTGMPRPQTTETITHA